MLTTYNEDLYSSGGTEPAALSPCNHEEGDCRAFLHCENRSKEGVNQAMMFTVDSDVAVIAASVFIELILLELWIESGKLQTVNTYQFMKIVKSLGPERARFLTLFHSFTGCDEVLFFSSFGKRTAWKTWQNYSRLTESLAKLPMVD